jgi:hypothetical protein
LSFKVSRLHRSICSRQNSFAVMASMMMEFEQTATVHVVESLKRQFPALKI